MGVAAGDVQRHDRLSDCAGHVGGNAAADLERRSRSVERGRRRFVDKKNRPFTLTPEYRIFGGGGIAGCYMMPLVAASQTDYRRIRIDDPRTFTAGEIKSAAVGDVVEIQYRVFEFQVAGSEESGRIADIRVITDDIPSVEKRHRSGDRNRITERHLSASATRKSAVFAGSGNTGNDRPIDRRG